MPDDPYGKPNEGASAPSIVENLLASAPIQRADQEIDLHEDARGKKVREIRALEQSIFQRTMEVLDAASRFGEVDPTNLEPSRAMMDDFGHDPEKLAQVNRLARYALMNAKEAPVGLAIAKSVAVGLARAQAMSKSAPRTMNVAILHVGGELNLPTQVLEDE